MIMVNIKIVNLTYINMNKIIGTKWELINAIPFLM